MDQMVTRTQTSDDMTWFAVLGPTALVPTGPTPPSCLPPNPSPHLQLLAVR